MGRVTARARPREGRVDGDNVLPTQERLTCAIAGNALRPIPNVGAGSGLVRAGRGGKVYFDSRSVDKGFRRDVSAGLLLQAVVADRGGSVQALLDVARLENVAYTVGVISPDAGETIGLEFDADRQLVRQNGIGALARRLHPIRDAEEIRHVMPDFVGDHIGLGEIAGRTEAGLEVVVETEVDIQLAIGRAIENGPIAACPIPHAERIAPEKRTSFGSS